MLVNPAMVKLFDNGLDDYGPLIELAPSGKIYATMSFETSGSGSNFKVLQISSLGSSQWTKTFSGNNGSGWWSCCHRIWWFWKCLCWRHTNDPDNPDMVLLKYSESGSLQLRKYMILIMIIAKIYPLTPEIMLSSLEIPTTTDLHITLSWLLNIHRLALCFGHCFCIRL